MTWRIWTRLVVLGLVCVVVQVGILDRVQLGGAHPDAWLLVAIVAGLVAGPQQGAVVAFLAGLVADLFVVTPFGVSSLCYVLVAFAVGILAPLGSGRVTHGSQVVIAFVASVVGSLLYEGILTLLGQPHLARGQLVNVLAVVSIANAVLVLPANAAMTWVFAKSGASQREFGAAGGSGLR